MARPKHRRPRLRRSVRPRSPSRQPPTAKTRRRLALPSRPPLLPRRRTLRPSSRRSSPTSGTPKVRSSPRRMGRCSTTCEPTADSPSSTSPLPSMPSAGSRRSCRPARRSSPSRTSARRSTRSSSCGSTTTSPCRPTSCSRFRRRRRMTMTTRTSLRVCLPGHSWPDGHRLHAGPLRRAVLPAPGRNAGDHLADGRSARTPQPAGAELGPPHFTAGMIQEFTVA